MSDTQTPSIPWFGARKLARSLATEVQQLRQQLETMGAWSIVELEARRADLERQIREQGEQLAREKATARSELDEMQRQLQTAREAIVVTEDIALLQEAGIYHYRHPLTDAVAYEQALEGVEGKIKADDPQGRWCRACDDHVDCQRIRR